MKVLFALLMIVTSMAASAQYRPEREGRIILRDGNSTVRISVNERSAMEIRMRLLEEAVRDLQAQVYDLRDEPRTREVAIQICSLATSFNGTFIGKASTALEAEANARNSCHASRKEQFCNVLRVTCQRSIESIRY